MTTNRGGEWKVSNIQSKTHRNSIAGLVGNTSGWNKTKIILPTVTMCFFQLEHHKMLNIKLGELSFRLTSEQETEGNWTLFESADVFCWQYFTSFCKTVRQWNSASHIGAMLYCYPSKSSQNKTTPCVILIILLTLCWFMALRVNS